MTMEELIAIISERLSALIETKDDNSTLSVYHAGQIDTLEWLLTIANSKNSKK